VLAAFPWTGDMLGEFLRHLPGVCFDHHVPSHLLGVFRFSTLRLRFILDLVHPGSQNVELILKIRKVILELCLIESHPCALLVEIELGWHHEWAG